MAQPGSLQQRRDEATDAELERQSSVASVESREDLEPLNMRILHSLEETINHSMQVVKDAVIGSSTSTSTSSNAAEPGNEYHEVRVTHLESGEGSPKGILQSVEDTIVHSVQSMEETIAHSVQTVKEAASGAAEAAASPAATSKQRDPIVTVEDEAAILVHSVIQE